MEGTRLEPGRSTRALEARLERHGEAVETFIAQARRVPPGRHEAPRAPGKWSPADEATHLVLTYREFAAVLEGAPEFTLLVPPEKAAQYRQTVLPRILAGNWFPRGAVAPDRVRPGESRQPLLATLGELHRVAERFHAAARSAAAGEPDRRWTHPYFGPVSLAELVDVLTAHAEHHASFVAPEAAGG